MSMLSQDTCEAKVAVFLLFLPPKLAEPRKHLNYIDYSLNGEPFAKKKLISLYAHIVSMGFNMWCIYRNGIA